MGEVLFDRKLLEQNRRRHARDFADHNFLYAEVANRIAENVTLFNRKFENILEIGAKDKYLSQLVVGRPRHEDEVSYNFCDDLEFLPFKENSFDLIISNLNFHFINEIPQFLLEVKKALKPNGIFIASFFGEENLSELAHVLHETELEIYGGVSPRMPPTIDVKTAANLLQKAGFGNPISDFEKIEVEYSNVKKLLDDLKFMGQSNVLNARSRRFFTKGFLNKISENYQRNYKNSDNFIKATFEIITITGWK